MNEIFLILLPLAAYSGWRLAKHDSGPSTETNQSDDYFRGLDYLLNDDTDNAIATFTQLTQINTNARNTRDIQHCITLGRLFRKRGEVDRALHLHQSLLKGIKQHNIEVPDELLASIHLSIADDFSDAGVMNRATEHYRHTLEFGNLDLHRIASKKLISLCVRQQQWQKAIDVSHTADRTVVETLRKTIAHCYCELAERHEEKSETVTLLNQALRIDNTCIRAEILSAELALSNKQFISAIGHYSNIAKQSPEALIPDIENIKLAFLTLNQKEELIHYLSDIFAQHPHPDIAFALAELSPEKDGKNYLLTSLEKRPSFKILNALITDKEEVKNYIKPLDNTNHALPYTCRTCNFRTAKRLWQCPGCDARESIYSE